MHINDLRNSILYKLGENNGQLTFNGQTISGSSGGTQNSVCNLYIDVNTLITGAGNNILNWSGIRYDNSNGTLWDSVNPNRLKSPSAGIYRATLSARFDDTNITAPYFTISGNPTCWGWRIAYSPANNTQIWSADLIMKEGSYAEAIVYSAGNVTLQYNSGNSPLLTWQKIG